MTPDPFKLPKIVEAFMAFRWMCPDCGHKNYGDLHEVELDDLDRPFDFEEDEHACAIPDGVSCSNCGGYFVTNDDPDIREAEDWAR